MLTLFLVNGMSATAFLLRKVVQNESYCLEVLSGAQCYMKVSKRNSVLKEELNFFSSTFQS